MFGLAAAGATLLGVVVSTVAGVPSAGAESASELRPLGLTCRVQPDDVRFCQGNGTTERVVSFDGTPLDTDVTLPPNGSGPFPTIVMLHGWGNDKTAFESTDPSGNGYNAGAGIYLPVTHHYNNDFYARRGYAVLTYSARGKGASCGGGGAPRAQLQTGSCAQGFIRLADQRYELRDTQHLLGLLVDQGIARPDRLAATGISYGGGQSLALAYLKDRVRCSGLPLPGDICAGKPDGEFVPWRSPGGTLLALTAAHPRWFWSDLPASLVPNGRYLDFRPDTGGSSRDPVGVPLASFFNGLLATGTAGGYYVTPQPPGGRYSAWDLTAFGAVLNAGEPYGAAARAVLDEMAAHHQGFGTPGSAPAALLLESGWNDELFPVAESLRVYRDLRVRAEFADVTLLVGDVGHSKASNKLPVNRAFNDQTAAFFDAHLRGVGQAAPAGSVTAFTVTCPADEPDGGPFTASTWDALHPGAVEFGGTTPQTVLSSGGDPSTGVALDPIATADSCGTVAAADAPGTAVYTLPSQGFTLLGLPTVTVHVATRGAGGQLVARLWDVAPDAQQRLVTRGVYRLLDEQSGPVTLQLHGSGYRFAEGHTVKLELLGQDAPYLRPSNGPFTVTVSGVRISLPVAEPAGSTNQVTANPYLQPQAGTGAAAPPAAGSQSTGPMAREPASDGPRLPATGQSSAAIAGLISLLTAVGAVAFQRRLRLLPGARVPAGPAPGGSPRKRLRHDHVKDRD
jgi:dienelactone hydrolase